MSAKTRSIIVIAIATVQILLSALPAYAAPVPVCYRTKTGIVCIAPGQAQTGGSGITPVKRWKN